MLDPQRVEEIELDLTTCCNAKCPLCFRSKKCFPEKYQRPFWRSSREILEQLEQFESLKVVDLVGQLSEPTTHPQFLEIVKHLKEKQKQIQICTNGDLHNEIFWKELASMLDASDQVVFAICGSTEEMHAKYRVGTSLQRILLHAKALRSVKPIDVAKCILFSYNEEDLSSQQFKDMIRQFSSVQFINTSDARLIKEAFNEEVDEFFPTSSAQRMYDWLHAMSRLNSRVQCMSVKEHSIQIDPFGDIFPCWNYFQNMSAQRWSFSYKNILQGKHSFCQNCKESVKSICKKKGFKF